MCKKVYSIVLIVCLFGCGAQMPSADLPPEIEEEEPFTETRKWQRGQQIMSIPRGPDGSVITPGGLSIPEQAAKAHLLFRYDSPDSNGLAAYTIGYATLALSNGHEANWRLEGEIEALGFLLPMDIHATSDADVHMFWAGVHDEEEQAWRAREIKSPHLFHCQWQNGTCSEEELLVSLEEAYKSVSMQIGRVESDPSGTMLLPLSTGYS
ncbi:MAG: hypothetical protein AAF730_17685, partial [Bacteroidota bacterium]